VGYSELVLDRQNEETEAKVLVARIESKSKERKPPLGDSAICWFRHTQKALQHEHALNLNLGLPLRRRLILLEDVSTRNLGP
jgi:hypothetical protein